MHRISTLRGPRIQAPAPEGSRDKQNETARMNFVVDLYISPHAPLLPPTPVVPPTKLLGGLTTPLPFSVPGLCGVSLGDAVPLPGTGLLSWGAAPSAWLLNALIWKGFLTGEVVRVREGSSVGEGARLLVLMGVGLGGGCGCD